MALGMECEKCKILKPLGVFGDYDTRKPICLMCIDKISKEEEQEVLRKSIEERRLQEIIVKEDVKHEKKTKKKSKRWYPKAFKDKSKPMLANAREKGGCTKCGSVHLLQVHHKDHDKFNNEDENLVVLCYDCHSIEHAHMKNKVAPVWLK